MTINEDVNTREATGLTPEEIRNSEVGVVGIGKMGASIVACLLWAGNRVRAIEPVAAAIPAAREHVVAHLESIDPRYRTQSVEEMLERLSISDDYADLKACAVVIESVLEDLGVKHEVIRRIEAQVSDATLIGSNTSALPITQVQQGAERPNRVLGLHWGIQPVLPLLEIIKGDHTTDEVIARAVDFARFWGKDPTVVRKDIRGFVANRLGYAMYREALYLYAHGIASAADIDRAARYGMGIWAAHDGPFGDLDESFGLVLTVMRDLFPELSNDKEVPPFLEEMYRSRKWSFYDAKAELNIELERRHLEGIAERTAEALARLDELEKGQSLSQ